MLDDDILVPSNSFASESELWLWLEVNGDEHPLDITGHYPVLAGFDNSGREIYVARIESNSGYTYVSDGTLNVSFADHHGNPKVSSQFEVMVLKHDPCDVHAQAIPKRAKFQTGPVYWMRREAFEEYLDSEYFCDSGLGPDAESGSDDSDSDTSEDGA